MRIKEIRADKFKRFTNLTIKNIPQSAKLVVLLGPNGCGKSSLFDAFKTWHKVRAYGYGENDGYYKKEQEDDRPAYDLVKIDFHEDISETRQDEMKNYFYFRTAYRNSPLIDVSAIQKIVSPLERPDNKKMIDNDICINDDYQRLVSQTMDKLFDSQNDTKQVREIRVLF